MIKVQCGMCNQILEAPNELAGKQAKCPTCQAPITVPAVGQRAKAPAATNRAASAPVNSAGNGTQGTWSAPLPSSAFTAVPPTMPPSAPQYLSTAPPQSLGAANDYRLGIAAVLSFFIPGLGQVFKRQVRRGLNIQAIAAALLLSPILIMFVASLAAAALEIRSPRNSAPSVVLILFAGILSLASFVGFVLYHRWQIYDAAEVK